MRVIVEQIKVSTATTDKELFDIAKARLKKTRAFSNFKDFYIYKRSIDARKKENIKLVYSVACDAEISSKINEELLKSHGIKLQPLLELEFALKGKKPSKRPLVVGFGPGGMFCALALSRAGLNPVVIERGSDVDTRVKCVGDFYKTKSLNLDTNIQFGAGGAGTFSDGKLNTLINDPKCDFVLKELVKFGAPEEICYNAKPHIGTDILRAVVKNLANEITSLGGEIFYNTKLTSFENGVAHTTKGDFEYSSLVLAIGHSARDTYEYLLSKGVAIEPKPFSVGVRVEHLQADINEAMYGRYADTFGPASYKISHRENNRGVYSFCMCPGGTVVAAQSEEKTIVTNGMSYYARDGVNANAALAVSVDPVDFDNGTPFGGIAFQRQIERAAYRETKSYAAPCQLVGDFLEGRKSRAFGRVEPTYPIGTRFVEMDRFLPNFVCEELRNGLNVFGRKNNAFRARDAVLTGPETRTSSPVRMRRQENLNSLQVAGLIPCGEGAGYAGGIMSAAVDGIRAAKQIIETYSCE